MDYVWIYNVTWNIWSDNKMSNDYTLKFDLSSYEDLDNFALLADQSYNLGDFLLFSDDDIHLKLSCADTI